MLGSSSASRRSSRPAQSADFSRNNYTSDPPSFKSPKLQTTPISSLASDAENNGNQSELSSEASSQHQVLSDEPENDFPENEENERSSDATSAKDIFGGEDPVNTSLEILLLKEGSDSDKIQAYMQLQTWLKSLNVPAVMPQNIDQSKRRNSLKNTNHNISNDMHPDFKRLSQRAATFLSAIKRDLNVNSVDTAANELSHAALKLLGYFLYHPQISCGITGNQLSDIVITLCNKIKKTADKVACALSIWCIGVQRTGSNAFKINLKLILDAIVHACNNFPSVSVTVESLQTFHTLFKHYPSQMLSLSKHWLLNVLPLLMNENVEVQRKADSFVGFMLPTIVDEYEKIDHCISEYMDKQSPKLIFELTNLSAQNEIFALQVWSKMVVILGRHLHQSAAYINGLLKIVEKCFNAKKFDSKMAAFRAWSYLAYNFSINGYLFQEKRIKLMLVPITNSFLHDKSPQLRLAAAYAWADIVYCLGTDNLSKFWNSACQPMLERILKDPSGEIREFGCHVLACLVNTQQVYDKPRPKHIIVGECKVWEYIMNTRLDLRWFRKNTKPFFELLILAISNPPECASEDWKIGEQSKEKLTPLCIWHVYAQYLQALAFLFGKEFNPSMEGLESINTILEFFRQLNSLSDTAFHLQHNQVSADVVRSELLGLFIREFLTAIPDHALSSPRYRNNECESEIFTAISTVEYDDLFPRKPIATPVIVLAKDLLTMARPHTLNEEFWKILEHLIRVGASCSGSMDTLYTFLCLIELRIENMEDSDSALMLWSLVATYLRQHAEKSNQINDNLDPENFEEDPEFIYTPLLVPLQIICSVGTRFTDSQLTEWRNLFCSLHKVTQASHKNQNHVVEKISEAFLKLLKNYESEIEEVQAGACRSIIDCYYTVSLAVKFPTSLDSQSPANGLGQRRNSRNKIPLKTVLDVLITMMDRYYGLLAHCHSNFEDDESIAVLFVCVHEFVRKANMIIKGVFVDEAFTIMQKWLDDDEGWFDKIDLPLAYKIVSAISLVLQDIYDYWKKFVDFDTETLNKIQPLLIAALRQNLPYSEKIEGPTVNFWNETFGLRDVEFRYPRELHEIFVKFSSQKGAFIRMPFHKHVECEDEGNVDTDDNSLNHEDCEIDKSHDETDHSYSDQYEDAGKDEEEQTTGDEKIDGYIGEDTSVETEQKQDDPVPPSSRNSLLAKDTYLRLKDSDVSPPSHSSHKRRISGNDDTVFVDISKKKKTRTNSMLTDKQREKLSHREADIPLMYNSLDSQNPNLPLNGETLEKQELAEKTVNQENSSQLPQDEYDPPLNQESEDADAGTDAVTASANIIDLDASPVDFGAVVGKLVIKQDDLAALSLRQLFNLQRDLTTLLNSVNDNVGKFIL